MVSILKSVAAIRNTRALEAGSKSSPSKTFSIEMRISRMDALISQARGGNCSGSIRVGSVRRMRAGFGVVGLGGRERFWLAEGRSRRDGRRDRLFPARVKRIASRASVARRRPVSITERMSA